jgi:hypothetical protein
VFEKTIFLMKKTEQKLFVLSQALTHTNGLKSGGKRMRREKK